MAQPLKSFRLFRKLPPEMQLMIWDFACHGRRILVLKRAAIIYPTCRVPPAVLHVCRLSRYAALRAYVSKVFQLPGPRVKAVFNSAADIVYLSDFSMYSYATKLADSRNALGPQLVLPPPNIGVRYLALDLSLCLNRAGQLIPHVFDAIHLGFPDLEELTFVISPTRGLASKSIVRFSPLVDNETSRWRDYIGRLQVEDLVRRTRQIEISHRLHGAPNTTNSDVSSPDGTNPNSANPNGTSPQVTDRSKKKFPKVAFATAVQESDWRSRDKRVRAIIKEERHRYLY